MLETAYCRYRVNSELEFAYKLELELSQKIIYYLTLSLTLLLQIVFSPFCNLSTFRYLLIQIPILELVDLFMELIKWNWPYVRCTAITIILYPDFSILEWMSGCSTLVEQCSNQCPMEAPSFLHRNFSHC